MTEKALLYIFLFLQVFFHIPCTFAQEAQNKDVLIINNEASVKTQAVTAPALVPSDAKQLREERKRQEITTEDAIVKRLEKERLLDEQKRLDRLFGGPKETTTNAQPPKKPVLPKRDWFFRNKAFFSAGVGFVTYPRAGNVNSMDFPAFFASFGSYSYGDALALDLTLYYSRHFSDFLGTPYKVDQPGAVLSVKFPFSTGKMKPYVGLSASLMYLKWSIFHPSGEFQIHPDITTKTWHMAFDIGPVIGADLALGNHTGLNADFRYHINVYAEDKNNALLEKRDSLIFSINFKYYF